MVATAGLLLLQVPLAEASLRVVVVAPPLTHRVLLPAMAAGVAFTVMVLVAGLPQPLS